MATQAAAQKVQPTPPVSRIGAVRKGIIAASRRFLIYGADGTGKSTLAASAPDPIFLDIEGGSEELEISRYPFRDDPVRGHVPNTYDEVLAAISDLTANASPYKTLVIDTIDSLEAMLWTWMIKRDNDPAFWKKEQPLNQIIDYGYGKGYDRAVDVWRDLAVRLDRLIAVRRMDVVLLAHTQIKNFKNPEGADYDRWVVAMNEKAAGFLKGWVNIVGRLCHEDTVKDEKRGKGKGISTGARVLKLAHSAAFDAKARGNMPAEIDIPTESPWSELARAIDEGRENDVAKLATEIAAEIVRIGDEELTTKVNSAVAVAVAAGDSRTLLAYLNNLKSRPAKSAEAQ